MNYLHHTHCAIKSSGRFGHHQVNLSAFPWCIRMWIVKWIICETLMIWIHCFHSLSIIGDVQCRREMQALHLHTQFILYLSMYASACAMIYMCMCVVQNSSPYCSACFVCCIVCFKQVKWCKLIWHLGFEAATGQLPHSCGILTYVLRYTIERTVVSSLWPHTYAHKVWLFSTVFW